MESKELLFQRMLNLLFDKTYPEIDSISVRLGKPLKKDYSSDTIKNLIYIVDVFLKNYIDTNLQSKITNEIKNLFTAGSLDVVRQSLSNSKIKDVALVNFHINED